jgi:hypothetical protein
MVRQGARALDSDRHVQLREAWVSVSAGAVVAQMAAKADIDEARAAAEQATGLAE